MREEKKNRLTLLVNATRIGVVGGLRTFAESFARALEDYPDIFVVSPTGVNLSTKMAQINGPAWLASSGHVSWSRPILWYLYSLVAFPRGHRKRILSPTHHTIPFCKRQVVTVHDLRPYFYPDSFVQKVNFRYLLPGSLKKCDAVLTVSLTSKELLVRVFDLAPSRVYVVPNSIDREFLSHSWQPNMTEPFLLSVGGTWKHKNITEIMEMHTIWKDRYSLKIVAGKGQYLDALMLLARELRIEERVEFITEATRRNLIDLYMSCSALVYPSLMEGFGLPPLEAMAIGTPTIVSDIPVFRELLGEIPIFVQLGDESSWRQAFIELKSLRSDRLKAGRALAESFSQERMRHALSEALESVWGIQLGVQDK